MITSRAPIRIGRDGHEAVFDIVYTIHIHSGNEKATLGFFVQANFATKRIMLAKNKPGGI